ncbi:hypothetical protein SKAU_G00150270 [Synaphobranchus kaupii]|uniref:Uncharacterized protein n=1 Tax=Synaphobranchus kaupii TaxID=118154 RepID=A0A9Q1FUN4_SYNKA|nr:hypothetical protein SKAU_G00150270 [Synaphobranchus kaupii]
METSQICKAVQSIWKKAGLEGELTSTLMRKSAVTKVHEAHPTMKAPLSDLMCHRVETASKCYRLVERERSSVVAAEVLRTVLSYDVEMTPAEREELPKAAWEDPEEGTSFSSRSVRGKRIFTSSNIKTITTQCRDLITAGPISEERVKEALKTTPEGKDMLAHYSVKQIISHLNFTSGWSSRKKIALRPIKVPSQLSSSYPLSAPDNSQRLPVPVASHRPVLISSSQQLVLTSLWPAPANSSCPPALTNLSQHPMLSQF